MCMHTHTHAHTCACTHTHTCACTHTHNARVTLGSWSHKLGLHDPPWRSWRVRGKPSSLCDMTPPFLLSPTLCYHHHHCAVYRQFSPTMSPSDYQLPTSIYSNIALKHSTRICRTLKEPDLYISDTWPTLRLRLVFTN